MAGAWLRARLREGRILVVAGVGCPLEARLIEMAGFEATYVSGYATAATIYGVPDVGLVGMAEVMQNAANVVRATRLPVIVDADTGYGDVANVRRTVEMLDSLGVAAVQIEDQVWPKRCGHMAGKRVEPAEQMLRKIRAVLASRRPDGIALIARTDARAPAGLEEAIRRANLYRDAGAEMIFVDAPESLDELVSIARRVPGPLVANMSETGKTPLLSATELQEIGYALALFPTSSLRTWVRASWEVLCELRRTGDTRSWLDRMASLDWVNEAVGLGSLEAWARTLDDTPQSITTSLHPGSEPLDGGQA